MHDYNGDNQAFADPAGGPGLTKLEYVAIHLMAATMFSTRGGAFAAKEAVIAAQQLLDTIEDFENGKR